MQKLSKLSLIDIQRINEIGGVENPDILRILNSFVGDLTACLLLIDHLREEQRAEEILATLHKLAGSSGTCGFTGINRAVAAWGSSANLYKASLYSNLRTTVEASIEEWRRLVG